MNKGFVATMFAVASLVVFASCQQANTPDVAPPAPVYVATPQSVLQTTEFYAVTDGTTISVYGYIADTKASMNFSSYYLDIDGSDSKTSSDITMTSENAITFGLDSNGINAVEKPLYNVVYVNTNYEKAKGSFKSASLIITFDIIHHRFEQNDDETNIYNEENQERFQTEGLIGCTLTNNLTIIWTGPTTAETCIWVPTNP